MTTEQTPFWVDVADQPLTAAGTAPRLAVVPCPPGGGHLSNALTSLRNQGIDVLVSLLTPDETRILRLEDEPQLARQIGINYHWFPVPDHSIPASIEDFRQLLDLLHRDLRSGKAVAAHCYAGIGRSCLLIACLLCANGLAPAEAFDRLSDARGLRVPDTWLQSQWVQHFADSLNNPADLPQKSG